MDAAGTGLGAGVATGVRIRCDSGRRTPRAARRRGRRRQVVPGRAAGAGPPGTAMGVGRLRRPVHSTTTRPALRHRRPARRRPAGQVPGPGTARRAVHGAAASARHRRYTAHRGHRGRALGRRGDDRPAAVPRPPAARRTRAGDRHLPRRRASHRRPAAGRARRGGHPASDPADRARSAERGRGRHAGRRQWAGRCRAAPADQWQSVLRHRGTASDRGRRATVGARCGPVPRRAAEPGRPRGAGDRRPGRHPGGARAADGGLPVVLDELLASGLLQDEPGGLRFRHEIARLAVAQAVPAHRGIAINTGILAALRSLGCTDDARLAYHADAAGDADAVVAHALPAAQRASELGSHREAAAQCGARPAVRRSHRRPGLGLRGVRVRGVHAGPVGGRGGGRRHERWNCGAPPATAGARATCCGGCPARCGGCAAATRQTPRPSAAIDVLEPLGASMELGLGVREPGQPAAPGSGHRRDHRIRPSAPYDIAEALDLPAVRSDALNTIATARAAADGVWEEQPAPLSTSLSTHNLPSQAGRAYSNLYAGFVDERRFADAEAVRRAASPTATSATWTSTPRACAVSRPACWRRPAAGTTRSAQRPDCCAKRALADQSDQSADQPRHGTRPARRDRRVGVPG